MLFYNRVSVINNRHKGIDINKNGSDTSRACYLCCFYFFKDKHFSYLPYVCSSCLELTQKVTKMLYYDRIWVFDSKYPNKTGSDVSKLCDLCYFFKNQNFKYQPYFCYGCHGLSQRATDLNETKFVCVKKNNYRILSNISCKESTQLLKRSDLTEKLACS